MMELLSDISLTCYLTVYSSNINLMIKCCIGYYVIRIYMIRSLEYVDRWFCTELNKT